MTSLRLRRHTRVWLLRGLRLVRRHHFSLLSAVVMGSVLAIALTSASFELDNGARAQPAATAVMAAEDLGVAPLPSPSPTPALEVEAPLPKVIYYIVNSTEEAIALYSARRADAVYFAEQGLPPFPPISVYYLLYETSEEERETQLLLNDLALHAPSHGIDFNVVDLRK